MKNKLLILRVTFALFLLISGGAFITQSSSANRSDCITDRFNAFLNANSLYSRAFDGRYRDTNTTDNTPVNCNPQQNYPHCNTVCSPNPASQECVSCRNACDIDNANQQTNEYGLASLGFAQGLLAGISSQFCTFEPDYCANAQAQNDICVAIHSNQLQNPVYDPDQKGVLDNEWFSDVADQYMMCREASGVDNCL